MDYEKAYKAVLKTATQWIKDGCTDKERICLESVFPELRESEDEKIRKALVIMMKVPRKEIFEAQGITKEQALAYLEKPKEQGHICDSAQFEEGFKAGRESGLRDGQKYVLNNLDSYGLCKPAEWSEENENNLELVIDCIYKFYPDPVMKYKLKEWLKSLRPVKQEWSEEDERILKGIIGLIDHDQHYGVSNNEMISWLKSLRPLKDCSDCAKHLEGYISGRSAAENKLLEQFGALVTPEGELHIKPRWKPSEEQMGALNYAYCELFKREDVGHNILGPLQKLLDDLKKLM